MRYHLTLCGVALFVAFSSVAAATSVALPGSLNDDLRLWVRADAGTGATTTGDTVSQWEDQSGNGNHLAQKFRVASPDLYGERA